MVEIIWEPKARTDLKSIHAFISNDSLFYADRFILKLIERIDVLQFFPLSGRIVPEQEDVNVRELIEGNYRIFYWIISSKKVHILRIHHTAQNISRK